MQFQVMATFDREMYSPFNLCVTFSTDGPLIKSHSNGWIDLLAVGFLE